MAGPIHRIQNFERQVSRAVGIPLIFSVVLSVP